ncbi:MAG TPA: putative solute-binding protein [Aquabacterium sp.]|uniref:putative solute-binding protein n=1 Tax=Aquabacterium sp. TaxID=1872578 RepID=UPI002E2FCA49|nr:putative solute-binding protein [Aquabacterium sp.]HEX5355564.1 putative solute-binding protein [Aquabacterium sp.]
MTAITPSSLRQTTSCLALIAGLYAHAAWAAPVAEPKLCVFDLQGASGDMFNATKDYALAMQAKGTPLVLKSYVDERVAADDFRTGQCDALLATAFRTRAFNPVTAATDSFGAALILRQGKVDHAAGHEVIRTASQIFNSPGAASYVVQGKYELAGLIDVGAVYAVVRDKRMNTPEAMAGKKILAFDHDKAQAALIQKAGAQPVNADITNFANKFNNGMADMAAAPAIAFKPLELLKGMGPNGAVSHFPYMIVSYQLIIDRTRFAPGFAEASRQYWLSHFDEVLARVNKAEAELPASVWMELSAENTPKYAEFLRQTRVELIEQGIYNKQGLKLLKRIRCKINPADSECTMPTEVN